MSLLNFILFAATNCKCKGYGGQVAEDEARMLPEAETRTPGLDHKQPRLTQLRSAAGHCPPNVGQMANNGQGFHAATLSSFLHFIDLVTCIKA